MSKVMLLVFLLCIIGLLSGITRIVDIDGTGQYTTIQSAIDAATSGDVVLVYPGRYIENVVIQTNGVTLQSLEATTNNPAYIDSTIIDGNAANSSVKIYSYSLNILVRGFSITNGCKDGYGGGIQILLSTNIMLTNCKIFNNKAVGGGGLQIAQSTVTLSGLEIYNNRCLVAGGGILAMNPGVQVTFDPNNRCSIYNNIAGTGQDIYIGDARLNIDVYLDTFTVSSPSNYYAEYYNYPGYQNHMNFHINNAYTQEIDHDMYVSPDGNDENDGLTPQTALKTIHTAIYRTAPDSVNQNTVFILPGTYSVSANQQIFPITTKSWVNVVGSGINNTHIIGEHHPQFPNINCTIVESHYMKNYTLSDLHLNYAPGVDGTIIYCRDESNLTIRNIKTENLTTSVSYLFYLPHLRNSVIDGLIVDNVNFYSGSIINIDASFSGIIKNWKITNCISYATDPSNWVAPLVWLSLSDTTIENCFFDNLVMSDDDSQCLSFGGVQNPNPPITMNIINSQFSHITGQQGIIHFGASNNPRINITNSTFSDCDGHDNTVTVNGVVNIRNSIFRNNTPDEVMIYPMENGEHSNLTLDYNSIQGGQAGIYNPGTGNQVHYLGNNTAANPMFNGSTNPDMPFYSLSADSPCRDTGTPDTTGLALPIADLAGNYRIWNNRIDMGCYEFGSEPVGNADQVHPEGCATLYNYPNPFNPSTTISYSLKEDAKVALDIYNIRGQLVKSLESGFVQKGMHSIVWDGKDDSGKACSSGVYFYRLNTADKSVTKKMLMLK